MSTYYGAVKDNVFHIRVMDKMLMHPIPDTLVTPAGKAFVHAVPGAVVLRQQSPLGAAAGHPEDSFNEASAIGLLPYVHIWTGA